MAEAEKIILKVIPGKIANPFIRKHHYSGSVVNNSRMHFGVFYQGTLHGVTSYGPSMNKQQLIGLVEGTSWNAFLELNRMSFDLVLRRNSESRAIFHENQHKFNIALFRSLERLATHSLRLVGLFFSKGL